MTHSKFVSPKGFPQITNTPQLKEHLYLNLTKEQRTCGCGNMIISKPRNRPSVFAYISTGFVICYKCHRQYKIKELLELTKENSHI